MNSSHAPVVRPYELEARWLWESSDLTSRQIGARFGVSKNTIIGLARRRGWEPRGVVRPKSTTVDRLEDLHRYMDRVLEETSRVVRAHPPSLSVVVRNPEGYARWLTRYD